jgi:hypothetical protein
MTIYRWILLRKINLSDKSIEKKKTLFFSNFFPESPVLFSDYVNRYGTARQVTDDSTIPRMRIACWITKATDMHSEYVIFITFSRQKWLYERASTLRYTYSTAQHSTAQYSTVQHSTAQHSTVQHSTAQHSTVQHGTVQYSTAQHSTAHHSTVQHSTAQYSTAQHSTAHCSLSCLRLSQTTTFALKKDSIRKRK